MTTKRLSYTARIGLSQSPVAKRLLQLMTDKKTNLALSADVVAASDLLALADRVGPEICILKTHIDIVQDFSADLIKQLQSLATKHQFLLFEDRKFADIGHTVKHQYGGGIYRIADWADMTNAHSLPGPGIIQGMAEIGRPLQRGLLLLAEMSSAGNLLDEAYAKKTLAMAELYPDFVFGFIAQRALSNHPGWLYLTPGIQFAVAGDALGQQYVSPETAIVENKTDIIIVGRGITAANDPTHMAREYRECAWKAYEKDLR